MGQGCVVHEATRTARDRVAISLLALRTGGRPTGEGRMFIQVLYKTRHSRQAQPAAPAGVRPDLVWAAACQDEQHGPAPALTRGSHSGTAPAISECGGAVTGSPVGGLQTAPWGGSSGTRHTAAWPTLGGATWPGGRRVLGNTQASSGAPGSCLIWRLWTTCKAPPTA